MNRPRRLPGPEMSDADVRQSRRFLLLYGMAAAGGAVAYVPFLTVLLPVRINELSGSDNIEWLAMVTFGGAIAASLANIGFGWLSDWTRRRRLWIALGLALSCVLLVAVAQATTLWTLIGIVFCWQISLNMMLAPLAAWAGDSVPDNQKGLLGGLLAFAPALGALSGALVTMPGLAAQDFRLVLVAGLALAMVAPVLVFGNPKRMPHLMRSAQTAGQNGREATGSGPTAAWSQTLRQKAGNIVSRMWLARLLVQIAEAALFAYLFFWLRTFIPDFSDSSTARLFGVTLAIAIPFSFLAGWWADRKSRPILPLAISAGLGSVGLGIMALAPNLAAGIVGYVVFSVAASVFLAQHSSQVLQVLPTPERRARDLGIFNLTNTVPSLIMPWIALALVPNFGFSGLFALLAVLAAVASTLLLRANRKT